MRNENWDLKNWWGQRNHNIWWESITLIEGLVEWWLVPKMHKQRQSVPKYLLWPAAVAVLIRYTFVSDVRTEFGGLNSSSFTSTFINTILRYGWIWYMNYCLILKTKTVLKDQGLRPLLCEVSVDKSMSLVWELHSNSTQKTTCNSSTVFRTWTWPEMVNTPGSSWWLLFTATSHSYSSVISSGRSASGDHRAAHGTWTISVHPGADVLRMRVESLSLRLNPSVYLM